MSLTLRVHRIPDDKDAWENVPPIVVKSIKSLDKNAPEIKSWIDQHERRTKEIEEQLQRIVGRADKHSAALKETREQVADNARAVREGAERQQREASVFRGCLGNLLKVNAALIDKFQHVFGKDSSSSIGEQQQASVADALAEAQAAQDDGLATLEHLGRIVEGRIGALEDAFGSWETQRANEDRDKAALDVAIAELQAGAEQTQNRLLAWRDLLKENSAIIEALNTQLDTTKFAVRDLQASQVRSVDVEDAVAESTKQLEDMHSGLEGRVEGIARMLDEYAERAEGLFEEARQVTDAQINEHSSQVGQLLERSLHPINAYLNTMSVKSSKARAELDDLSARVPELAESLRDTLAKLVESDGRHGGRADELARDLASLADTQARQAEAAEQKGAELFSQVRDGVQDLEEQVELLRTALRGTEQTLVSVRQQDVASLSTALENPEEKVAQWVHARPLPAKISEARLYSLEARLNEEMQARFVLESSLKPAPMERTGTPRSARTPPLSNTEILPALPQPAGGPPPPATKAGRNGFVRRLSS